MNLHLSVVPDVPDGEHLKWHILVENPWQSELPAKSGAATAEIMDVNKQRQISHNKGYM